MEALLRRNTKNIYVVPNGLKELMTDISREVLREYPKDICKFIADYLDALMVIRENSKIASKLVDDVTTISEATVEFLLQKDLSPKDALESFSEEYAEILKNTENKHGEDTDILTSDINWKTAVRNALQMRNTTGATKEDLQQTERLIKVAYKNYYSADDEDIDDESLD